MRERLAQFGEDPAVLVGVAGVRDAAYHGPTHDPGAVDHERPPHRRTFHLIEHAIATGHLAVGPEIREQRELEPLALGELSLHVLRVDGDRQQLSVVVLKRPEVVAQHAQLARARTGERPGIEDEKNVAHAPKRRKPYRSAVLIDEFEIGSDRTHRRQPAVRYETARRQRGQRLRELFGATRRAPDQSGPALIELVWLSPAVGAASVTSLGSM